MADWSMFGGGGGVSAAIADQGQLARTALEQGQLQRLQTLLPGEVQGQQAENLQRLAQTKEIQAKTTGLELQNQRTQLFAQKLQGMGIDTTGEDGKPLGMSGLMAKMAGVAIEAGSPEDAANFYKMATTIYGHDVAWQTAEARRMAAQVAAQKNMYDDIERSSRMIDQMPDPQAAWQQLGQRYKRLGINLPEFDLQWSPELGQALADQALSQKQRLDVDYRNKQLANRAAIERQRNELKEMQVQAKSEADARKAAAKVLSDKGGGKFLGKPSAAEVEAVMKMVGKEMPEALSAANEDTTKAFAQDVATKANQMRKANPAIEPSVARARAFNDKRAELKLAGNLNKVLEYKPAAMGTKEMPLPVVGDPSKRDVGTWYIVNGTPLRWAREGNQTGWSRE